MDNVYQSPALTPPPAAPDGSRFDLDRALNLGWQAFKANMGFGVGYTLLLSLLMILAVLSCLGIFAALPHLTASVPIIGLLMVRGKVEMGDVFRPFRAFGSIFGAWLLIAVVTQLIAVFFSLPYYLVLFQGLDWSATTGMGPADQFGQIMKQMQTQEQTFSGARLGTNLLSLLNVPVSLYISARVMLVYPLIVERGMGAMDAIRTSLSMTRPYQWPLIGLAFMNGIIASLGILACCVGILFSIPLSLAIQGAAIYQLLGEDTGAPIDRSKPAAPAETPPSPGPYGA